MIEKLEPIKEFDCSDTPLAKMQHHSYHNDCINKINELVDAVNKQQQQLNNHMCRLLVLEHPDLPDEDDAIQEVIHTDPYAEQRRWIGKLCRFWDSVYDRYYFNTLKGITDEGLFIGHNGVWKHCEPVKPDDDIIYKGEQQC